MFSVGEVDVKGLQRFENMLWALGAEAPKAVNRALDRTGDMARTQVVHTLARQTGLPQKTIRKAVKVTRPTLGSHTGKGRDLSYTMTAGGGNIDLRYFNTRETRKGVVAYLGAARGRKLFEGAFMRGGRFPNRVQISIGAGHVWERVGVKRLPIENLRSDVFIPQEMVEGATADAFESSVQKNLPRRLDHEISRLLGV